MSYLSRTRCAVAVALLLALPPASGFAAQQSAPRIVSNVDALGAIDASARYLFFLHARIVEDQGLPAVSPKFGAYRYHDILQRLAGAGFNVISEVRPRDARAAVYAERVATQVRALRGLLDHVAPGRPVDLVGFSLRGMVVSEFAIRHPERVRRVALIAPAGVGTDVPFVGDER